MAVARLKYSCRQIFIELLTVINLYILEVIVVVSIKSCPEIEDNCQYTTLL